MWRKVDYTGMKFGRWTVLGVAPNHITRGGYSVAMWDCICACGTRRAVRGNDLRLGKSVSCGCYMADNPASKKHGATGSYLYKIYHGMRSRCYNQRSADYKYYGGRGIKICDEWQDYEKFQSWAQESGYVEHLTIDRINVNGNYSPENCRWTTRKEQAGNKRTTVYLTAFGKTKTLVDWASEYGQGASSLRNRIKRGWNVEDAISLPIGARGHVSMHKTARAALPGMEQLTGGEGQAEVE